MDNALALNYTGAWRDPVIDGLPLGNGYRTYLPDLMRFTAPDDLSPFGEGGVNPYAYCSGDPINFSDPSGQFQLSWTGALGIVAAIFGLGLAVVTGGSSLAVLGVASAATGIGADNTEGTLHDVLMGASIVSGVAGGIMDAADIAKGTVSALQLAGGIGRSDVRTEAAASEAVARYSARTETVETRGAAVAPAAQAEDTVRLLASTEVEEFRSGASNEYFNTNMFDRFAENRKIPRSLRTFNVMGGDANFNYSGEDFIIRTHAVPYKILSIRGTGVTGREFAKEFKNFVKYYDGSPIRLSACQSGCSRFGVAQQIANELGVEVNAPLTNVRGLWSGTEGRVFYPQARFQRRITTMASYILDRLY